MQALKGELQKNNFLISQPKYMLWVLKRTVPMSSFEHPKHMLKLIGKKIFSFSLKNCVFLVALYHRLAQMLL